MNDSGLLQRAVRALESFPELVVVTDVALDPYSSDGHDGVVVDDRIDNDVTVPVLAAMAVAHAKAGTFLRKSSGKAIFLRPKDAAMIYFPRSVTLHRHVWGNLAINLWV